MQHNEEDIDLLNSLGLTTLQAQVYLTLIRIGKASVKTISTNADIDRAHVYRVISSLHELKLVQKILITPTAYQPLPIDDGIRMLLENKTKELKKIELKAEETIKRNKKGAKESIQEENGEFAIIPDNKMLLRKLYAIQGNCHSSYDFIFNAKFLLKTVDSTTILEKSKKMFKDLMDKGVKIRLIACLKQDEKLYKEYAILCNSDKLELRYTYEQPSITLTLADRKEALFNTVALNPDGEPSLWTKNPLMAMIFQKYFDHRWRNSKKAYIEP
jgi:sugar-specific transcriptional regulator TrmB